MVAGAIVFAIIFLVARWLENMFFGQAAKVGTPNGCFHNITQIALIVMIVLCVFVAIGILPNQIGKF